MPRNEHRTPTTSDVTPNPPSPGPRALAAEPASFRDPASRVFYTDDGAVVRALTREALDDFRRVAGTEFFARSMAAGKVVRTEPVEPAPEGLEGYAAALRHDRVPFVSYPYEWPFSMLKDAALLQLDLLLAALAEDVTLKDASPYNVQWRGARPVFIDVGSFEPLRPGEPWEGYRQFCQLFLYPLMLQAYTGVPFNPWLRGSLEGIEPDELRRLLSFRDRFRRGVFTHVRLHAALGRREADRARPVRDELKAAGFGKELIEANARTLRKLVEGLRFEPDRRGWSGYGRTTTYDEAGAGGKAAFVSRVASERPRGLVWDLGANDGSYTRLAAPHADYTVAIDSDPGVVELLYRSVREDDPRILPLVVDLLDPSPGRGWRGRERVRLEDRGRPELVLCLALVHHLAITGNVPLAELVDWLAGLGGEVVVEFVTRDDPMARRLLERKRPGLHGDYERELWERLLGERFELARTEELAAGTRVLYHCRPQR